MKTNLRNLHQQIVRWAKQAKLNTNPTLPDGLNNRPGDNWRPLISIADSFGWGQAAREAALAFNNGHYDEVAGIRLLSDIRDIFNARDVDRIKSAVLVSALVALEDAPWSEWRGVHDDQTPRPLSQNDLARLLFPFNIKTQTVWPLHRHALGESSGRGYYRSQFEAAWISYCPGWADTPTQPVVKEEQEWVSPLA